MTLPVAVDAMGGDDAPIAVVEGALEAVREGLDVVLVGRRDAIAAVGGESLPMIEAADVIEMSEEPSRAVRTKKDSSISRAVNAVRDGEASAMVSAGNTGAVAAAALLRLRRLPGVARPAIATAFPVPGGRTARVLLDSGAMADCSAQWLHQFARLGSAYSRIRFGVAAPRVGLLSIGEEPEKGNMLVKETHQLLAADDEIDFYGNVEGGDLLDGPVDVVVTDGFTGNVLLKSLEGHGVVLRASDPRTSRRGRGGGRRSTSPAGAARRRNERRQHRRSDAARRSGSLCDRARFVESEGHHERHQVRPPDGRG